MQQHTYDFWQILSGLATLIFGCGWITEAIKNRGNFGLKRVDELAAYRQELRADLEKQKTEHCEELAKQESKHRDELKELSDRFDKHCEQTKADIKALQDENRDLREITKKQNEQLETVDRELFEERINRQQLEDRVLFMIQYRLADKEAWIKLADELTGLQKSRKPRAPRKGTSDAELLVGEEKHPRRILIVDDMNDTRKVLQLLLERAGYEVEAASNGAEALTLNANAVSRFTPFHAIVSDVNMPALDGIEMGRALSNQGAFANGCKLAFFTADGARTREIVKTDPLLLGVPVWEKPLNGEEILTSLSALWAPVPLATD